LPELVALDYYTCTVIVPCASNAILSDSVVIISEFDS